MKGEQQGHIAHHYAFKICNQILSLTLVCYSCTVQRQLGSKTSVKDKASFLQSLLEDIVEGAVKEGGFNSLPHLLLPHSIFIHTQRSYSEGCVLIQESVWQLGSGMVTNGRAKAEPGMSCSDNGYNGT